jgi:hypothetical protein
MRAELPRGRSAVMRMRLLAAGTLTVLVGAGALLLPGSVVAVGEHVHTPPPVVQTPAAPPPPPRSDLPSLPSVGSLGGGRIFAPARPDENFSLMEVYARKAQDIDRLFVTVRMHDPGTVVADAGVNVPAGAGAGASGKPTLMRFARITRKVPPHLKSKLSLRLGVRQLRSVKHALRQGKSLTVNVTVTGRNARGQQTTAIRTVRLRFEGIGGLRAEVSQILAFLRALVRTDVTSKAVSGAQGPEGPPGPPGRSALTTLGPNETIRGNVGAQLTGQVDHLVGTSETFPIPVPFSLDDDHVTVDGVDEASDECQGTFDNPTASPGYVCIYPFLQQNVLAGSPQGVIFGDKLENTQSARWGFQVSWRVSLSPFDPPDTQLESSSFFAVWAYTAPENAPIPSDDHHH